VVTIHPVREQKRRPEGEALKRQRVEDHYREGTRLTARKHDREDEVVPRENKENFALISKEY